MSTFVSSGYEQERPVVMSGSDPEGCEIPAPMTTVETVITTHGDEEEVNRYPVYTTSAIIIINS